ncbi:MAG: helix-turn-helix transcriptional regulator [Geosporobacter ferrireducens]|nr:helix-turn-helix transcriptional regulator [Geosporobacter ferrireducens]
MNLANVKKCEIKFALKRIKQIRESTGLTQKDMADKLGISESFYCQLEGGKRKMTIDYGMKIAHALSKSLDEIFLHTNFSKSDEDIT